MHLYTKITRMFFLFVAYSMLLSKNGSKSLSLAAIGGRKSLSSIHSQISEDSNVFLFMPGTDVSIGWMLTTGVFCRTPWPVD